jgi:NADH-quinone oxidoreductase subunit L
MTAALALLVLVPIAAGALVWTLGDHRSTVRAVITTASLVVTLAVAVTAAVQQPTATIRWGSGLSLQLGVAGVARGPVVLVAFVGWAVTTYSLGYGEIRGRARMVGLLVAFVGAMELLLVAGDWLALLTAWELVGFLSWALIAHHWRSDAPGQAGHAFIATRAGDLGLFAAAGAAFAASGSLDFTALTNVTRGWAAVVVIGVLLAAVAKSAQLPFSPWLFSAMSGPTPVSALLHSATMVAAGAYLLARLHPFLATVSWFGPVTIVIGLTTALAGGVVALLQPEAKKLLAASTSAHYGLMFVAVGAGYPTVAIAHLIAHGLFKALLFISSGVAIDTSGSPRLENMQLGRRVPAIAAVTAVGSLALAAVPPLGAAWTKEEIVAAAGERAPWLAVLVVLAGALSAGYAARFQLLAYGRGEITTDRAAAAGSDTVAGDSPSVTARRAPSGLILAAIALTGLAVGSVLLGVLWLPIGERRLTALVGGDLPTGEAWETVASLLAVALAFGVAVLARARGRLLEPVHTAWADRVADWFDLPATIRTLVVDPVLALARGAARFDDRVVDAGVQGVPHLTTLVSSALAGIDRRPVEEGGSRRNRSGTRVGRVLNRIGEAGIDGTIEGLARLAGAAGRRGRRLQSGETHRYYAGIAVGLVVLTAITALWR